MKNQAYVFFNVYFKYKYIEFFPVDVSALQIIKTQVWNINSDVFKSSFHPSFQAIKCKQLTLHISRNSIICVLRPLLEIYIIFYNIRKIYMLCNYAPALNIIPNNVPTFNFCDLIQCLCNKNVI